METIISTILFIVGIYLALGIIFSIAFLWKGIAKVDDGAKETGLVFKMLLFPGLVVFWVYFLRKWLKTNTT
ncbi:MAG: hypothetical protein AB8F94_05885 [Saprospiraceae bacterium]